MLKYKPAYLLYDRIGKLIQSSPRIKDIRLAAGGSHYVTPTRVDVKIDLGSFPLWNCHCSF